jgi:hypothetical protein
MNGWIPTSYALLRADAMVRMSDSDRPIISPWDAEELEVTLHKIEERHWIQLSDLQVGGTRQDISVLANLAGKSSHPKPPPPKQPLRLENTLGFYAQQLFEAEAAEYPNEPQLEHWLLKLAERVCDRVMRGIKAVEAAGHPWKTLAHHGLSDEQMRTSVGESLEQAAAKCLEKKRALPPPKKQPSPPAMPIKSIAPASTISPVKEQLLLLIEETRLTRDQVAEDIGIDLRNHYRHLSGNVIPGKKMVLRYEQYFSKKLARPVRISLPSKDH